MDTTPMKRVYRERTLLDKRRTRRWLLTFEPDAVVGRANFPDLCPLAAHIKAEFAELEPTAVKATSHHVWLDTTDGMFMQPTPAWARIFMSLVDSLAGQTDVHDTPDLNRTITAREALAILDRLTKV